MAFDPSIFDQANKPTVALRSPFEVMGQAAEVQNKLNSIRDFQSRQAVGQAYQQATDADGNFSPNKFRSIISQDPAAALGAQEANTQAESLNTSQQARGIKTNDFLNATLPGLLQLPDDKLHDGAAGAMDRAVTLGLVPQTQASQALAKLSTDPAALRRQLNSMQLAAMPAGTQRDQIYGTPAEVQTGDTTQFGVRPPASAGGGFNPATTVQQGMSPAQRAATTTLPLPGGQEEVVPTGDYATRSGINPTPNVPGGVPRMRVQRPGAAAAPAGSGPGATPAGGGLPAGPAAPVQPMTQANVRQSPAAGQAQSASVDAYGQAVRDSTTYNSRITALDNAAKALDQAKTGDGSQVLQTIASRIQTLTPGFLDGIMPNIRTPDEIAAYDEAKKYLSRMQLAGPGASRSDQGLSAAGAASPSVNTSPQAAKLLVQALTGQDKMQQAQLMEFHATHPQGTEDQYARWTAQQALTLDPRAFVADKQTQAQRNAILDSLPEGSVGRKNYLNSYIMAKRHGLVGPLGN